MRQYSVWGARLSARGFPGAQEISLLGPLRRRLPCLAARTFCTPQRASTPSGPGRAGRDAEWPITLFICRQVGTAPRRWIDCKSGRASSL